MRPSIAWMLAAVVLLPLALGCEQKTEEPVAVAPDLAPQAVEPFPDEQIPEPEPQPVEPSTTVATASPPAETYAPPVDTTATATVSEPATTVQPQPLPKESYAPAPKQARTYTVKKGDTLQKISKRFYGTTRKWRMLYNVNRDVLKKGPDFLQIGMKIKVP